MSKADGYDPVPRPPTGASSKARVHDVFRQRLVELRADGKNFADAFKRNEQRQWNIPADLSAMDLFKISSLHEPSFEREPINTNYLECFQSVSNMGTVGDVLSLKFQLDYNAAEERAFRFRHASVCRNLVHSLARRRGHGSGPLFEFIEREASDRIKAGAKSEAKK
jgi:hypothetical protein